MENGWKTIPKFVIFGWIFSPNLLNIRANHRHRMSTTFLISSCDQNETILRNSIIIYQTEYYARIFKTGNHITRYNISKIVMILNTNSLHWYWNLNNNSSNNNNNNVLNIPAMQILILMVWGLTCFGVMTFWVIWASCQQLQGVCVVFLQGWKRFNCWVRFRWGLDVDIVILSCNLLILLVWSNKGVVELIWIRNTICENSWSLFPWIHSGVVVLYSTLIRGACCVWCWSKFPVVHAVRRCILQDQRYEGIWTITLKKRTWKNEQWR